METHNTDSTSWVVALRAALASRTLGLDTLRTPEERRLAGRMTGLLYLLGAVSAVLVALLPNVAQGYTAEVLALAAAGGIWGSPPSPSSAGRRPGPGSPTSRRSADSGSRRH